MEANVRDNRPVLAVSTRLAESLQAAAEIAAVCGFGGVDLAITTVNLDRLAADAGYIRARLGGSIEIRYHAYLPQFELGNRDSGLAAEALERFKRAAAAVGLAGGNNLTVHIGSNPTEHGDVSFNTAVENLSELVDFAAPRFVDICVENLRKGMTAAPELFAELVEQSHASATLDVGHALSSAAGQRHGFPFETVERLGGKILNAHIYEGEDDKRGHIAPNGLSTMSKALDALRSAGCGWWVIELAKPAEIHLTNALLNGYFHDLSSDKDEVSAILAP